MKKFAYYILMIFAVAIFFWNFSMLKPANRSQGPPKIGLVMASETTKEISTESNAKAKWPDPWRYLLKLTGPEIFSAITLPFVFVILNIMGKAIPNLADIKSPGARTQSLLNTLSAYTDLSLVSIASVFCAYQFLPEEKEITKSMVGDFILWLLFTFSMFILACLIAGLSGQTSRPFRDKNSIIGVHIPNALGMFSIFISSIICIKMGVK